ncbi:hypothetical protein [Streptomyces indicus]|uniref:Uncharacterized protein n=1 Tax=Streptomyces indicus TaxID=417292 RepID=A0A1G9FYB3_9ACTN|nr:hypothetical protein [Streptomyces indicus]SDK93390.1 hypothetical protein SAMN05421806_114138 [Streptomyces indicus]
MGQPQTLTRGARITGSFTAALIALISAGWIVRDLYEAESAEPLWRLWTGLAPQVQLALYSSLMDLVLFLVGAAVAVTAVRSPSAASSLVAAGVLAIAGRAPSVWLLMEEERFRVIDIRVRLLAGAAATVGLGLILLLLAAFGRRPVGESATYSYTFDDEREPPRPTNAAAATAFIFLGAAAAVSGAWQVHHALDLGWRPYRELLVGDASLTSALDPPVGWLVWAAALFALVAAVSALQHASFSRALGMTAAVVYLVFGAAGISWIVETDRFDGLFDAPLEVQLDVLSQLFYALAGAVSLLVLFRGREGRGEPAYGTYGGWDPADGTYGPPPPSSPPPGW